MRPGIDVRKRHKQSMAGEKYNQPIIDFDHTRSLATRQHCRRAETQKRSEPMPKKNPPKAPPKASTMTERQAARRTEPLASGAAIDTFENAHADRDYLIHIQIPEFTCHCPLTGQPDFAHITIDYIPDKRCIELKALKMYMWSFRDIGAFHEKVTNDICDVLSGTIKPRYMRVTGRWNVRGGIYTNVVAEHRAKGWKPQPKVDLTGFGLANPAAV
jgi:7-cyano-7-deazaguanine reductase